MKGLLKLRPSPALVISIVALVMATIGTAIAATNLPKNSVSSKQLKNNAVVTAKIKKEAVTGAKVKKNTLTGKNINLSKLGTVPSATTAATATTAQSLTPLEPVHRVGAPGEPPFEEEATNFGPFGSTPTGSVGFYKDHEGIVHLVGDAKAGKNGVLFRLPAGFRPTAGTIEFFNSFKTEKAILVAGTGAGSGADGLVIAFLTAKGEPVFLGGITFRAES